MNNNKPFWDSNTNLICFFWGQTSIKKKIKNEKELLKNIKFNKNDK